VIGATWWAAALTVILFVQPDWPRWLVIGLALSGAVGYSVIDLMPWSMLGEVVDEDDVETGERREGIYYGLFMFARKLAGALAVWLALTLLGVLGYDPKLPPSQTVLTATRWLTSVVPAVFLLLAAWLAHGYQLTRARHAEIRAALERR